MSPHGACVSFFRVSLRRSPAQASVLVVVSNPLVVVESRKRRHRQPTNEGHSIIVVTTRTRSLRGVFLFRSGEAAQCRKNWSLQYRMVLVGHEFLTARRLFEASFKLIC